MSIVKNENNVKLILIEGNIGAGKTTFLKLMQKSNYFKDKYPDKKIAYVFEPVNEWLEYKDSNNKDILTYFYEDQEKFAFSFQWYVFITRIKAIDKAINNGAELLFIERSIFTDRDVFINTLYQKNKLSEIEYKIYMDCFNLVSKKMMSDNFKFVYLQLPTKECHNRIVQRSRDAESIIDYDYLDLINKNHDISFLNNPKTLVLNSKYSPDDTEYVNKYFSQINELINTLN
jgi:deoxyadenosine/deoxycytidine kinase